MLAHVWGSEGRGDSPHKWTTMLVEFPGASHSVQAAKCSDKSDDASSSSIAESLDTALVRRDTWRPMYVRTIKVRSTSGTINEYIRVVEAYRHNGKVKQRVVADLGRKDLLVEMLPKLSGS